MFIPAVCVLFLINEMAKKKDFFMTWRNVPQDTDYWPNPFGFMPQAVQYSRVHKAWPISLFPLKNFQRSMKHFCACFMFQCVEKLSVAMEENVLDLSLRGAHVPQDLAELSAK